VLALSSYIVIIFAFFGLGAIPGFLFKPQSRAVTIFVLVMNLTGSLFSLAWAILAWKNLATQPWQSIKGNYYYSQPLFEGSLPPSLVGTELPVFTPTFYADRLSLIFVGLVALIAGLVALYSIYWLPEDAQRHKPQPGARVVYTIKTSRFAGMFNLAVLATLLTLLANDVFYYLCFLEGITLAFSYLTLYQYQTRLASHEIDTPEFNAAKLAFRLYLIFNHAGIMLITAALLVLAANLPPTAQSLSFDTFRQMSAKLSGGVTDLIFVLGLAGYSIKAGIFFFHVWVSRVHPYTPTSMHALLSGVILKVVGIYGMLRLFFDFMSPHSQWWGVITLLLAGLTALFGVFNALVSRDLKAALASHSVENLGIILAGIGLALLYSGSVNEKKGLVIIGLVACLFHTVNHAIFKSLLFLATGAIENRTGTVKLNRLGGLLRLYPWTGITFLVGAVSITGFPPFNGFASEWLTLQGFLAGFTSFDRDQRFFGLAGLVPSLIMLSFAFSLTALAFVKLTGEALLGPLPPDNNFEKKDPPWQMKTVLVLLALLCCVIGITPGFTAGVLQDAVRPLCYVANSEKTSTDSALEQANCSPERQATTSYQPTPIRLSEWGYGLQVYLDFNKGENANKDSKGSKYQAAISGKLLVIIAGLFVFILLRRRILWLLNQLMPGRKKAASQVEDDTPEPLWLGGEPPGSLPTHITGSALTSLIWLPLSRSTANVKKGSGRRAYLSDQIILGPTHYVVGIVVLVYNQILGLINQQSARFSAWLHNGDIRRYLVYIFLTLVLLLGGVFLIGALVLPK
jgi:formate hydrogenlyase subunit 3/multisubunit Na+/H+ antiporter MnhD subunit